MTRSKSNSIPDPPGYTTPTTVSSKVPRDPLPHSHPKATNPTNRTSQTHKANPRSPSLAQSSNNKGNKHNTAVQAAAAAAAATSTARKPPTPEELNTLKLKKAWELALAPAKSLPMSAVGMYMTGNSLQIFSIMMVFMLFKTPVTAILNMGQVFARFESDELKAQLLGVKAVYVLTNLLALGLGVWKVNGMGLLP